MFTDSLQQHRRITVSIFLLPLHILAIILLVVLLTSGTNSQNLSRVLNHPPNMDGCSIHLLPRVVPQQSPGPDSVVRYDFTITLRDGVILDCLKFIPFGVTPPTGGWPTVIMCHGYGDNKNTLAGFCHDQATYGYYTATFSMRGEGASGGLSNLISTTEMLDLLEFITAVKNDSVNGSNPGNILIMGGSQGGLIPFMAACNGAPVKTIISALAPPNFASSWIENGSIKMTFLWTVTYNSDTARYNALVSKFPTWVYTNTKATWDSLAANLPVNRDFMSQVANNHVPMIIEGSWQDKFFNVDGDIQAASLMTAPFSLYLGAVIGHGGDQSVTENTWHMNYFNNWFFYWLYNYGTLDSNKYQYASTTDPFTNNAWTFVHSSSSLPFPQITATQRYYFRQNKTLTATSPTGNKTLTFKNQVGSGLTMQQAVDYEFTGTSFTNKFKKDSLVFTTTPFVAPMKILGTPTINLKYKSSAHPFCQFDFQIYEIDASGNSNLVTRGNFTDRNYTANSVRTNLFKTQAHSHIFAVGTKMKIVLTNLDVSQNDAWFLGTNPFVLPVLNNGTHTVYCDGNTYINFPVTVGSNNVTMYNQPSLADQEDNNNMTPAQFSLKQNYPNPFNPSTTIVYSLPSTGKVVLKVYDILGKEVATLVNDIQDAGVHQLQIDASNLASGVYFYRINAVTAGGNFTDIKKMILVK